MLIYVASLTMQPSIDLMIITIKPTILKSYTPHIVTVYYIQFLRVDIREIIIGNN